MKTNKEDRAEDYFKVTSRRVIAKSVSGRDIEAIRLADQKGLPHPVYHIHIGKVTEIFYDIQDAAEF